MKPKKYSNKNLNQKKTLFFQIGLVVALSMILILVEWKTEAKLTSDHKVVSHVMLEEEEIPVVNIPKQQPERIPEPKIDSNDFIIDEELPENQEVIPEAEKIDSDVPSLEIDELEKIEDEPITEIGFEFIEDVPIFPGCEQHSDNKQRKSCMSEQIRKFINKEFNSGLASELGLQGINRIYTSFKIKANGEVEFLNARAPHPKLKEESQRVIEKLPRMQPGKQRGHPVDVIFALPITFKVSD
ncbi:energy transducer TonB [Psychroflexus sp. CAK8W]|uniref:Energy transducer TonB n=1 Tax=Psychroflexus longus TaxID=2873596 RepID=A0ABS7XJK8_9FLAO|nr:energy transducer TonB [Psychroflexus longus]MBZ9778930.1 energy transducer TonB [Psychroflexus longus]